MNGGGMMTHGFAVRRFGVEREREISIPRGTRRNDKTRPRQEREEKRREARGVQASSATGFTLDGGCNVFMRLTPMPKAPRRNLLKWFACAPRRTSQL